jgi:hypothetical protein
VRSLDHACTFTPSNWTACVSCSVPRGHQAGGVASSHLSCAAGKRGSDAGSWLPSDPWSPAWNHVCYTPCMAQEPRQRTGLCSLSSQVTMVAAEHARACEAASLPRHRWTHPPSDMYVNLVPGRGLVPQHVHDLREQHGHR